MVVPYGGSTPLVGQDGRITAEAPAATSASAPVVKNGVYRLIGSTAADGSAYKMVAAQANDVASSTILCVALHEAYAPTDAVGVLVLNPYAGMVVTLAYDTTAPTLGHSVKVAATVTQVVDIAWDRAKGTVLSTDTANKTVEVLFA